MMAYDGERVAQSGMFQGYNKITCTVVVLQVGKRDKVNSRFFLLLWYFSLIRYALLEQVFVE